MTARGRSSLRDTAARYPVSLFVSSPTTPHAAKSSTMRVSNSGSFNIASAAARSSSDMSGPAFSSGVTSARNRASCRVSSWKRTRHRSRRSRSDFKEVSAEADSMKCARSFARHRSTVSRCQRPPQDTRRDMRRVSKPVFFARPRTRYSQSPSPNKISSGVSRRTSQGEDAGPFSEGLTTEDTESTEDAAKAVSRGDAEGAEE